MTTATHSWSVGETRSLTVKAARGVGMPWGIAEEAGFALDWLVRHGAPGVTAMCRYLSFYATGIEQGRTPVTMPGTEGDGWVCPLGFGTALSDGAINLPDGEFRLREPMILIPFLAACAGSGAVRLTIGDISIDISSDGFHSEMITHSLLIAEAECRIASIADNDLPATTHPVNRVGSTMTECIAVLTRYAHNTYAPATEASRLAGAGAGLSDND